MNRATRINVATSGVILAISGMLAHGLFEVLQGSTPTEGLIIQAIGPAHRMWVHGSEEAFTLIPNYLATGLLAMAVGLAIMVWSVGFVHRRHGALVFLLMFILLFLVGGGIGQVLLIVPASLAATRINKPLAWWRRVLPEGQRRLLARLWPWFLVLATTLFLLGLVISVTGWFPGVSDPDQILRIDWSMLLTALVLFLLAFVAGFAYDIGRQ
jgi:hypothetical protein